MSSPFTFVLVGTLLLFAASLGLSFAARIFQHDDAGSDRFLPTCLTCATLVWMFTGAAFCIGKPVVELQAPWDLLAGAVAFAGLLAIPRMVWWLFGPRAGADGPRSDGPAVALRRVDAFEE